MERRFAINLQMVILQLIAYLILLPGFLFVVELADTVVVDTVNTVAVALVLADSSLIDLV